MSLAPHPSRMNLPPESSVPREAVLARVSGCAAWARPCDSGTPGEARTAALRLDTAENAAEVADETSAIGTCCDTATPPRAAWDVVRTAGRGLLGGWVGVLIDALPIPGERSVQAQPEQPASPPDKARSANGSESHGG